MGVTDNIKELKNSINNIKTVINELVLNNKKLERENLNFKKEVVNRIEPEVVSRLTKKVEFYQEREVLLKKKIERLIKRLDNLESFDLEEEEVSENETEGILNG